MALYFTGEPFAQRLTLDLGDGTCDYSFKGFWRSGDRLVHAKPIFDPEVHDPNTFRDEFKEYQMGFNHYYKTYSPEYDQHNQTKIYKGT